MTQRTISLLEGPELSQRSWIPTFSHATCGIANPYLSVWWWELRSSRKTRLTAEAQRGKNTTTCIAQPWALNFLQVPTKIWCRQTILLGVLSLGMFQINGSSKTNDSETCLPLNYKTAFCSPFHRVRFIAFLTELNWKRLYIQVSTVGLNPVIPSCTLRRPTPSLTSSYLKISPSSVFATVREWQSCWKELYWVLPISSYGIASWWWFSALHNTQQRSDPSLKPSSHHIRLHTV